MRKTWKWKTMATNHLNTPRWGTPIALIALSLGLIAAHQLRADGPPMPGEGGGGGGGGTNGPGNEYQIPDYGTNLHLRMPVLLQPATLALTVTNAVPGIAYDLLAISNLNETQLSSWQLLGHFAPDQKTYFLTLSSNSQGYYSLRESADSDHDGIPDYQEDLNGNGVVDSGETDRNSSTDLGLKVQITHPCPGGRVL